SQDKNILEPDFCPAHAPQRTGHLNASCVVMLSLSKHEAWEKRTDWLRRTPVLRQTQDGKKQAVGCHAE
ncbi:MAG: hypothetical protein LBK47_07010, partial [Prevotellaceae bacterium]|nr:hypothetical protein [Prevotellaceae bacterium]